MKTPTTKQELKDHIDELIKKVDAMPDETSDDVDYAVWWPEKKEYYWGYDYECANYHKSSAIKHSRQDIGGIFKTEEDRDTFVKVDNRYYELMDGVVLDWSDEDQVKYCFEWNHYSNELYTESSSSFQTQGVKYMNKEVSDAMLEEFTDAEFKLWILGGARR